MTTERGYILTGEARYLQAYQAADGLIQRDLADLQKFTGDNPAQQTSLVKLQAVSEAKLANLRQTIALRQESGLAAAVERVRSDADQKYMEDFRDLVTQMQTREAQSMKARTTSATVSARSTIWTVGIWTPLSLLILTVLAVLVTRKVRFGGPGALAEIPQRAWGTLAWRYGFVVVTVAVAAALRWWLERSVGPLPLFVTFYPAVLLVVSIAWGGPGILASILAAAVATFFFVPPYLSFAIASTNDFLALCIFTCTNLFLCVLAERLSRARRAEAVAEQKELLKVTLESIGDGVIVTDAQGRLTFLNGEAERLTGWKLAEARGQPLPIMFRIINEESRLPVENPVEKVLRLGTVVGLANHTLLIAKDGRETPIDDSGAPIRDAEGAVHGVVLVFRDFSEKKWAERERDIAIEFLRLVNANDGVRDLLKAALSFFRKHSGCEAVGLRLQVGDDYPYYETRGFPEEFVRLESALCAHHKDGTVERDGAGNPILECMCGNVIQGRYDSSKPFFTRIGSFWTNSTTELLAHATEADRQARDRCNGEGYESVALIALGAGEQRLGLLQLNDKRKNIFTAESIALWERLAGYLAVALGKAQAEETLQESEERYKILAAATFEGIVISEQGRFVDVNQRLLNMLGYSREELIGHDMAAFMAPEDRERIREVIQAGRESHVEHQYIRKDGSRIIVEAHGRTVDYQNRRVRFAAIRDITSRKQAEAALRQSENSLREAQKIAALGSYVLDIPAGRWTSSEVLDALFGIGPDYERTVEGWLALIHPDERGMMLDYLRHEVIGQGHDFAREYRIIRQNDQAERWVHGMGRVVFDAQGRPVSIPGTIQDITERKRVEATLRESEERYRNLFNSMDEGFALCAMIYDAAGKAVDSRYLSVNPAFEKLTGLSAEKVVGKRVLEVIPGLEPFWIEHYDHIVRTGQSQRIVNQVGALGRRYEVYAYSPERGLFGAVFMDVTARLQAVEALAAAKVAAEEAQARAEAASKAKDHFIAVLSHELRNPLNPVLAAAPMLRQDPRFDSQARELLEVICRNTELEARLIDDLLDVTRIERGKVELDRQNVDLRTIIRRAAEVCQPDIESKKLTFGIATPDGPYWIDADAARIQQVIWNLLKNAIKFTPQGGKVGLRCQRDGEGFVVLQVTDSGVGIAPALLGRLFNAFEQADRSITRQFGGLGLGLTISKALVEMHGGSIRADSLGKGAGATFTVRLPLRSGQVLVAVAAPKFQDPTPLAPSRRLRILLVEDHEDTVRTMRRLLEADGHQVQTAGDVATALKLSRQQVFDLLLSDLGLPNGSGLDLMRELRAQGFQMLAIALSGFGQDADIQQSLAAGFLAHLTKPVRIPKLKEAIAKFAAERTGG